MRRPAERPAAELETVRSYYERWIELQPGRIAHTTLLGYRSHFKKAGGILEPIGSRLISQITRDDLEFLRTAMLEGGASSKHAKNAIGGSFRAFIRDSIDAKLLDRNPFENFRWKRVAFEGADPYSPEELEAVLDALRHREFRVGRGSGAYTKRTHFPYYVAAFTVAWTGMRPEEVVAVEVRDFEPRRPGFNIRRAAVAGRVGATKTVKAERPVALTPENAELVKLVIPLRAKPTDPVFRGPEGGRMDQAKLNNAFTDECRRLGIPARGLYSLKDTSAPATSRLRAPPGSGCRRRPASRSRLFGGTTRRRSGSRSVTRRSYVESGAQKRRWTHGRKVLRDPRGLCQVTRTIWAVLRKGLIR